MAEPTHRATRARELAGLSLGQAAKLFGWPRKDLELVEATDPLHVQLVAKMLEVYKVNEPWLLGRVPLRLPESTLARMTVCMRKGKQITREDQDALLELFASMEGR